MLIRNPSKIVSVQVVEMAVQVVRVEAVDVVEAQRDTRSHANLKGFKPSRSLTITHIKENLLINRSHWNNVKSFICKSSEGY